jgi:hypothetical protein
VSPELARLAMLHAELERDWSHVRTFVERASSVEAGAGLAKAALVALSLDHAYEAFETLLLRIERALGLPERTGAQWHRALLADATLVLPGVRPAIVPPSAERQWDELRRFRHFLRHSYAVELDAKRLARNVQLLGEAVDATAPSVAALLKALRDEA